jgi:hypothetical protein
MPRTTDPLELDERSASERLVTESLWFNELALKRVPDWPTPEL